MIKLNLNDKKNDIEKILLQFGFEEYEKLFKRDIEEIYSRLKNIPVNDDIKDLENRLIKNKGNFQINMKQIEHLKQLKLK